jgi:hypothetical protein
MAISPKLLQVFKDMGTDDLQVLATELLPAVEDELNTLFPAEAQALEAGEAVINPLAQPALQSLISKIEL